MTKLQEQYLQQLEAYTKEYDMFCKEHVCDGCQIFAQHQQTGMSCFKIFMSLFHQEFDMAVPKE